MDKRKEMVGKLKNFIILNWKKLALGLGVVLVVAFILAKWRWFIFPPQLPPEEESHVVTISPELRVKAKGRFRAGEEIKFELFLQKEIYVFRARCERPFEIFDLQKGQNLAIHGCAISGEQTCRNGKIITGPLYSPPFPTCEPLEAEALTWDQKALFTEKARCGLKSYTKHNWRNVDPGNYTLVFNYYLGRKTETECQGEIKKAEWKFEIIR